MPLSYIRLLTSTDHVRVDDPEFLGMVVVPNLVLCRVTDKTDFSDLERQLHHTYQVLYIGDIELCQETDLLTVTLLDSRHIQVTMPSMPSSFVKRYDPDITGALSTHLDERTQAAHSTMIKGLNKELEALKFYVLIEIDNGDTLTNKTWCPTSEDGVVEPVCSKPIQSTLCFKNGMAFDSLEVGVPFNIARVEHTKRYASLGSNKSKKPGNNLVADALDLSGLKIGNRVGSQGVSTANQGASTANVDGMVED